MMGLPSYHWSCVFFFVLLLNFHSVVFGVDICKTYPIPDPCLPGGVWDPVVNSCTGYYGRPCYQCFSGPYCETKEDPVSCHLDLGAGNPLYLSEFWLEANNSDPCTTTLGHYRNSYQLSLGPLRAIATLPALTTAIKDIHFTVGNAKTDDRYIITGMGATMVINLAVMALSKKLLTKCASMKINCPDHVDVFAQTPYYSSYPDMMDLIPNVSWNVNADPSSPWTIEIVTYPNNPDGAKRTPLVQNPEQVIYDMVYYWPMYTEIDEMMDKPVMIFSSSKHDGLAGSRFGWGLVKDPELAQEMSRILTFTIFSMSVDIELRILTSMQAILSGGVGPGGLLPFHKFGREVIFSRFEQLRTAIKDCPQFQLMNSVKSPGAYAWIHCDTSCDDYLTKANLLGKDGKSFGGTDQDIRFTMLSPTVEFDIYINKIYFLCFNN